MIAFKYSYSGASIKLASILNSKAADVAKFRIFIAADFQVLLCQVYRVKTVNFPVQPVFLSFLIPVSDLLPKLL